MRGWPAGVSELGIGILVQGRGILLFVGKDSAAVREEFVGDAIGGEDLVEYMVVSVKCLLDVEPGAKEATRGIIDGHMEMPDLPCNPFKGRGIHLEQLAEISAPETSGMGVPFVTFGERMYSDSKIEATADTETEICSWVSSSSV